MERVVAHLAAALLPRGVEPLVICLRDEGALASEVKTSGVRVIPLHSLRGYDVRAALQLASLLQKFKPDVINVHDYSSLPYVATAGLVRRKCPIVFTAHGLLYNGFEGLRRRYRFFSRRLRAITAVSEQVRDRHVEFLDWRGATHIVPNGVPDVRLSSEIGRKVRRELGIGDDDVVFLAVGNPRPEKAFEDLVEACRLVHQMSSGRRFWTLIVGTLTENEYCQRLSHAVDDSQVPGLRLLGFREDVHRLYSAANALVVSSRSEGLPMVVLEALTAGLPIVSTRVGGIPDAVPPSAGILVEPAQPRELAEAMLVLMNLDATARGTMGDVARNHALSQFGVSRMAQQYLDVFASVAR